MLSGMMLGVWTAENNINGIYTRLLYTDTIKDDCPYTVATDCDCTRTLYNVTISGDVDR